MTLSTYRDQSVLCCGVIYLALICCFLIYSYLFLFSLKFSFKQLTRPKYLCSLSIVRPSPNKQKPATAETENTYESRKPRRWRGVVPGDPKKTEDFSRKTVDSMMTFPIFRNIFSTLSLGFITDFFHIINFFYLFFFFFFTPSFYFFLKHQFLSLSIFERKIFFFLKKKKKEKKKYGALRTKKKWKERKKYFWSLESLCLRALELDS